MKTEAYKLTCLTNLHMGSGDINYHVIDLEVERDAVLGEPTMNASGVKGALRDACVSKRSESDKDIEYVFGGKQDAKGNYSFFSGDIIARPVRVTDGDSAFVLATTPQLVRQLLEKLEAFDAKWFNETLADLPALQENKILCGKSYREIEGVVAKQKTCPLLEKLIGENWALMSTEMLSSIDLPVQAHNVLENGISRNLWYEQNVPHQSVFYLLVSRSEERNRLEEILDSAPIVQFGAGATTGCGYVKLEKKVEGSEE